MTDFDDALNHLPHGPGFRFITQVTDLVPGQAAQGVWVVSGNEWFLPDHFPGRPLVPGVLLTESLAQLAGLAAFGGAGRPAGSSHADNAMDRPTDASTDGASAGPGMLAAADMRYHEPVAPPATIDLTVTVDRALGRLCLVQVQAMCHGRRVASGTLAVAAGDPGSQP